MQTIKEMLPVETDRRGQIAGSGRGKISVKAQTWSHPAAMLWNVHCISEFASICNKELSFSCPVSYWLGLP